MEVRTSWVLFIVAGVLMIIGLPTGLTQNFWYWAFPRALYGVGVLFFWLDK